MSADTHTAHAGQSQGHDAPWHAHAHAHGHDDHGHGDHGHGAPHGTFRSYMIGFVLSVILTAIPFWMVMAKPIADTQTVAIVIMVLAAVQMVVHMIFFLHMSPKAEGGWTIMALIFTLVLVAIALTGSLWVMYHLNANMMPMSMHDMSQMP